jgi:hypothetical protein
VPDTDTAPKQPKVSSPADVEGGTWEFVGFRQRFLFSYFYPWREEFLAYVPCSSIPIFQSAIIREIGLFA